MRNIKDFKPFAARNGAACALGRKLRKDGAQVRLRAGARVADGERVALDGRNGAPDVNDCPAGARQFVRFGWEVGVKNLAGASVGLVFGLVRSGNVKGMRKNLPTWHTSEGVMIGMISFGSAVFAALVAVSTRLLRTRCEKGTTRVAPVLFCESE
jgi:hypothetical protein